MALWDRVLIQVWQLNTTSGAVRQLTEIARAFSLEVKAPICSLAIIERTSPPPNDEVRALLAKFYRDLAPQMNAQVVVIAGGGFHAAIVRAVGLTISTLAPRALPFRFVGSVQEAIVLLEPHLSTRSGGAAVLTRVLGEVSEESRRATLTA